MVEWKTDKQSPEIKEQQEAGNWKVKISQAEQWKFQS